MGIKYTILQKKQTFLMKALAFFCEMYYISVTREWFTTVLIRAVKL